MSVRRGRLSCAAGIWGGIIVAILGGCDTPLPAPVAEGPLYCYQTLGSPECYAEPQPGAPNRLIGTVSPPPAPATIRPPAPIVPSSAAGDLSRQADGRMPTDLHPVAPSASMSAPGHRSDTMTPSSLPGASIMVQPLPDDTTPPPGRNGATP